MGGGKGGKGGDDYDGGMMGGKGGTFFSTSVILVGHKAVTN